MNSAQARPRWWKLYLAMPVFAGFALVDTRLQLSAGGHQVLQAAALLTAVGWVRGWLRSNASALRSMDGEAYGRSVAVRTYPLAQPSPMGSLEDPAPPALEPAGRDAFDNGLRPALGMSRRSEML